MGQPDQNVVYRLDAAHDPAWQFYSMPESVVGGSQTLADARAQYRDALRFTFETADLPAIHEYVEQEIGNLGVWLRIPVEQGNFDARVADAERQIEPDESWQIPDGTWECSCAQDFELKVNLDAHVADAVIKELGLKQQNLVEKRDRKKRKVTRYVTEWEATDD